MIHITMILEDLVLTSTLRMINSEDEPSQVFDVHVCDGMTGESGKATWTKDQWRAVMTILVDDDDQSMGVDQQKRLYDIAEPAVAMLPDSCRPIP